MSSRSISLLRYSRIFYTNHQLVTHHFLHERPPPQQQSQFGFYSPFNRYFHHDQAYRQQDQHTAIVKEKIYAFEVNRQIPTGNVRFVEYENLFAFDVLKEKHEYNYYQNIATIYRNTFLGYEPYYLASSPGAIESLLEDIDDFNFSQILALLSSLILHTPFKSNPNAFDSLPNDSNFWLITEKLDKCCLRMLNTMSRHFEQSKGFLPFIAMTNLFYELGVSKHISFVKVLTRKLCDFQGPLCSYSFLQMMFLLNIQRDFHHKHRESILMKTEDFLRNESSISVKDLTLVAMGFFKTQTRMRDNVLVPFMNKCLAEFSDMEKPNFTTSLTSILKVIRYSFETNEQDLRRHRPIVRELIDVILHHPEQYINSAIVASHLIQALNSAQLQDQRNVYKQVFDKMVDDLDSMRIKDIERVLFCMANAEFMCNNRKLKTVEDFVYNSRDAQMYPYFVYSLFYYLRIMGYYPKNLLKMMKDPKFLQHTIDTRKEDCYEVLILNDTILRLLYDNRNPAARLLMDCQVTTFRAAMYAKIFGTANSKHTRFLRSIRDVLQPKYGSALKFIYLFPFSSYPFPVLLDAKAQKTVEKYQNEASKKGSEPPSIEGDDVIPYNAKLSTPNLFKGSTAFQILLIKDYLSFGKIRGFANMNTKLLKALGLNVLQLHQKEYNAFLLPEHMVDRDSKDYADCSQRMLTFVESKH